MGRSNSPVSREALYEEVWTDPVSLVSPRYGLSDVGLVKICKKLRVPVPGRGYWAKVKAGRPPRKVPLPALPSGTEIPSGPTMLSEEEVALRARVQDVIPESRVSQLVISVPSELVNPHPLVRAAAARLRQRDGWDHPAGVRSAPKEVLDLQVTKNCLDRALRLMDTLLKVLESCGFTARVEAEEGETLLVGSGTTLAISIIEQVTRTGHIPTPKEVRARERYYDSYRTGAQIEYPNIPEFDWHPTGRLTITAGRWPSRKWNDTERRLMDSRLPGIVAAIIALAESKRAEEEKQERRKRAYHEARALYETQVRARNDEHRNLRALLRDANRLQRANRLREFIAAVEERALRSGELTPEKEQWIEWANAKADWLDPLVRRADPILDSPEPIAPSYWDF